ncbi:MAG: hypothetical protein ACREX8_06525 [Gammaproteobacteria bacterium]
MSETPLGPGWWQASDGRWYPPETHPAYRPPAQGPGQPFAQGPRQPLAPGPEQPLVPGFGQPTMQGPPPMQPAPKSGVPKGLIIAGVIVVALLVGGYAVTSYVFGKIGDSLVGESGGECTLVEKKDVDSVLGSDFELLQLGGLTKIATPVLDSRVLADATTCWATENNADPGQLVRIARLQASDAGQRFQQERTLARGVKDDRGGGITVESQPYFNKDVQFGDEAFCTTTDFTGASGMLVRRGDTLVYVSLTSGAFNPQIDPSTAEGGAIKFADDDAHCALAQQLAEKVR